MEHTFDEASNTTQIKMPKRVTGEEAQDLVDEILALRNNKLKIIVADVERFDTPCLEVLLAAAKLWSVDECSLIYSDISEQFEVIISELGLKQTDFETGASL